MKMPTGTCPLCLRQRLLVDSHFIPAAIYRTLRAPHFPNPDPMIVTSELAMHSSIQIKAHVFCSECEQRFSKEGEAWSVSKLATRRRFPLLDLIQTTQPVEADAEMSIHSCKLIPTLKQAMLTHFALGVFWKASVYPWRVLGKTIRRLDFGPYAKGMREFLLGVATFPNDLVLLVLVDPLPDPIIAFSVPLHSRSDGIHKFHWYVNGVEFMLFVGKKIPNDWRSWCFCSADDNPISLMPGLREIIKRRMRTAPMSKRVSKNVLSTLEHYKNLRTDKR
jgi:hypothetical protein